MPGDQLRIGGKDCQLNHIGIDFAFFNQVVIPGNSGHRHAPAAVSCAGMMVASEMNAATSAVSGRTSSSSGVETCAMRPSCNNDVVCDGEGFIASWVTWTVVRPSRLVSD